MLSLGCERLPTPLKKKKKKKKVLDHYLHHDLGMLSLLRCFFAHLLILQYPDHHQNLISSYLYYSGPVHKISSQSVHNFLSNVVHRQTNKQTNRQTNATKNITSFAKEVKIQKHFSNIVFAYIAHEKFQNASFNSNRDIRQNIRGDGRDGDGTQNNTSRRFSKTGGR